MKKMITSMGCTIAILSMTLMSASAQDDVTEKQRLKRANQNDRRAISASQLDDKTSGTNIRASQLIGMNIQNKDGKNVGEINDIVIDAKRGVIRYAAVTYGGFLGINDKMFAVPFGAFKWQQDPNDADDYVLVLNVTKQQLEGDKGFDQDHWPDFADRTFTGQVDRRYGVDRDRRRGNGRVNVDVDEDGVDVDVDETPEN